MPQIGMGAAIGQLDPLFRAGSMVALSDADLLDRLLGTDRDVASAAFELVVRRHGTMVLATCRGVLRNEHDAEDAFQTTFLTFARRAGSVRCATSLGAWLHRVALRVSERARARAARRLVRERTTTEFLAMAQHQPPYDVERDELHRLVHHEVDCLPEHYRTVLLLCDLERATYERAAARLGVPVGTIRSRLSRARERLRSRLVRRGFTLSAGAIVLALSERNAPASVLPRSIASTLGLVKPTLEGLGALGPPTQGARWLMNLFGVVGQGRSILAIGFIALAAGIVASDSGIDRAHGVSSAVRQDRAATAHTAGTSEKRQSQNSTTKQPERNPAQTISRGSLMSLLDEARKRAADLKDARSRARMLLAIGTCYAKLDERAAASTMFDQSLELAMAIEDRNKVYLIEEIAVAQTEAKDRKAAFKTMLRAFEVTEKLADQYQRNDARMWIVRTFARAGALDEALRIVRDLPETNMCRGRALGYTLGGLKACDPAAARLYMPSFLKLAEEIGDRTRWAECMMFLAEALTDAGDIGDLLVIADKLAASVSEFGLADQRGMICLHSQIKVLSALGKAQARAGNREAAIATFNKAESLAAILPGEGESLRSDRLAWLARDRAGAGDVEGAMQTAALIVYEYHKALALVTIAGAQAEAGRRDEARALFLKAVEAAREIKIRDAFRDRPDDFDINASGCLRLIAYVQARTGFIADALLTADSIREPLRQNSALASIAPFMAKHGQIKPALELAQKIGDERAKNEALEGIALAQAVAGDLPGALAWARSRATPEGRANALLGVVRAVGKR